MILNPLIGGNIMTKETSRTKKINLLKELKSKEEQVSVLFKVVELNCPYILENPEEAPDSMVNDYNRFVQANISIIEIKNNLLI